MRKNKSSLLTAILASSIAVSSGISTIYNHYQVRENLTPEVREFLKLRTFLKNTKELDNKSYGHLESEIINTAKRFEYIIKTRPDIIKKKKSYEKYISREIASFFWTSVFGILTGLKSYEIIKEKTN